MPNIPNKLYFRIGEVSKLLNVEPYVLRYWESEFTEIKPSKSKSGQRLYKRRDVEMLVKIKELLYDERYTINGARKRLKETPRIETKEQAPERVDGEPRQLEVFSSSGSEGAEQEAATSKLNPAHGKTLKKIRKDLELLLGIVRGEDHGRV
ncbi:MAG: MerR family regulatory protein [bacterium ADurb.Bin270]|nr:MerR family transcriptional regulator [Myxococcales bacterium]OQA59076.1 MAG: MerR family regulatory protein [bacterium ADurb.Bin270]